MLVRNVKRIIAHPTRDWSTYPFSRRPRLSRAESRILHQKREPQNCSEDERKHMLMVDIPQEYADP
jgi:hypothetical protein